MASVIMIVEPKEHITKLWGKQEVKKNVTYRRFTVRLSKFLNGRL